MNPHDQLERLLAEQLDGGADPIRNAELATLLREHPELHAAYLDQVQMHALLQWRGGQAAPRTVEKAEPRRPARWSRRRTAALLLATAAGLAALFFFFEPEAQATDDVVDRLVTLNIHLAQAAAPEERSRIYEQHVPPLKTTLAGATLPPADRELAETLLENSTWLTKNDDPISEADRFSAIMDKLVTRMDDATQAKDEKRIVQLAGSYQKMVEAGIDANLVRAAAVPAQKSKVEHMTVRRAALAKRFTEIVQRNPEPSRRAIHRAMKGHHKKK